MSIPPVKNRKNKAMRGALVLFLASAMLLTSLMTVAQTASRDVPRPDLGITEFYADKDKPMEGEDLTIYITVHNHADYVAAIGASLELFVDDQPGDALESWVVDPLAPGDEYSYTYTYDTTGMRGTRVFTATVSEVDPYEANDTFANNNASLEVPIYSAFMGFDKIYEGNAADTMAGIRQYSGFLALFDNAKVLIEQDVNGVCDFKIVQTAGYQFGIILSGSSTLDIKGCKIHSQKQFYITVMENARLTIEDSILWNATIRSIAGLRIDAVSMRPERSARAIEPAARRVA